MSDTFISKRIQSRQYHVTHVASGRRFELIGKQGIHYWIAREITQKKKKKELVDVVSKFIFADDWQSKKKLLVTIDEMIIEEGEKQRLIALKARKLRKKHAAEAEVRKYRTVRFKPEVYAKLTKKKLSARKTKFFAETGEEFLMEHSSAGYTVTLDGSIQPIALEMRTEQEALLELYFYLDIPLTEDSNYRKECFKQTLR